MKLIFAAILIALFSFGGDAQDNAVEKNFTRNLSKYKVEKYSMGEDASSGYDYLVYKRGAKIVKIRTVWSSSANPKWWVEDAYYEAGAPVLLVSLTVTKRQFKSVIRGLPVALPVTDKCYFKDSKMVKWIENGKTIPQSDTRWAENEKDSLASAKNTIEFYPELKDL